MRRRDASLAVGLPSARAPAQHGGVARLLLPRLTLLTCAALVACGPPGGNGRDGGGPPVPTAIGAPVGEAQAASLDRLGGRVVADDGSLVIEIPAGALAQPRELSVQRVTNTAPGGVGQAYRLSPEGLTFAQPVTLTFTTTGLALEQLTVAYQEGQGYWLRVAPGDVTIDTVAQLVRVRTTHFSGWSLVTTDTSRDLHGTFTLSSDLDLPYTGLSGSADFTWAGEDPGVSYYLLGGTITLPDPLTVGADECSPTAPETASLALRTNTAELRASPAAFSWGVSGHWTLTCVGPGGTSSQPLLTAFDTQGISHSTCARSFATGATPITGPDRVQASFLVDCGAKGRTTATWRFSTSRCDTACVPANPCERGTWDCGSGTATCVSTGAVPDGEAGGCPAQQTCQGGACAP